MLLKVAYYDLELGILKQHYQLYAECGCVNNLGFLSPFFCWIISSHENPHIYTIVTCSNVNLYFLSVSYNCRDHLCFWTVKLNIENNHFRLQNIVYLTNIVSRFWNSSMINNFWRYMFNKCKEKFTNKNQSLSAKPLVNVFCIQVT